MARHVDAAELLGQRIVSGELRSGMVLPSATELARDRKLSRPAMREAIKILVGKGLVHSVPGLGTVVRPRVAWNLFDADVLRWHQGTEPTAAFIRDLYQLRRAIEPEASSMVALHASPDALGHIEAALDTMSTVETVSPASIQADLAFHQAILVASGNAFLVAFAPVIEASLVVAFRLQRKACPVSEYFVPAHRAILTAIKRGDPVATRDAMTTLLERAERHAMESLRAAGGAQPIEEPEVKAAKAKRPARAAK